MPPSVDVVNIEDSQPTQLSPLFKTTFTLTRLSPLYLGPDTTTLFDSTILKYHARRLRDQIRGDVLRGVRVEEVGAEATDEGLEKAGRLSEVRWLALGEDLNIFEGGIESGESEESDTVEKKKGVLIEVEYELATYIGILLFDSSSSTSSSQDSRKGFMSFPVLLTRMPTSLRSRLQSYLSSTFDTYASTFSPSSSFLASSLESYLSKLPDSITKKDIVLTLGFPIPTSTSSSASSTINAPVAPMLKNITMTVSGHDISNFLSRGQRLLQLRSQNSDADTPSPSYALKRKRPPQTSAPNTETDLTKGPFMAAMSLYTLSHMALPIEHPDIKLLRVACGGYVLGGEGKIKIFEPTVSTRRNRGEPGGRGGGRESDRDKEEREKEQERQLAILFEAARQLVDELVVHAETIKSGNDNRREESPKPSSKGKAQSTAETSTKGAGSTKASGQSENAEDHDEEQVSKRRR
jgi:hypothetical protein